MRFKRTALRGPKGARWRLTGNVMLVDNKRGPVITVREAELVDRNKYTKPHMGAKQLRKARDRALIERGYYVPVAAE